LRRYDGILRLGNFGRPPRLPAPSEMPLFYRPAEATQPAGSKCFLRWPSIPSNESQAPNQAVKPPAQLVLFTAAYNGEGGQ